MELDTLAIIAVAICLVLYVILERKQPPPTLKQGELMNVSNLIPAEIELINEMFSAHQIKAEIQPQKTMIVKSSFISYGIEVKQGERIGKIEAVRRELSNALTQQRVAMGVRGTVPVRLSDFPLSFEVPHPSPTTLRWNINEIQKTPSHSMLAGRSYLNNGSSNEIIKFDKSPHVLVAGITGAGKSVLLQMMMLSLCHNTPPEELEIVLIDLKNEDMLPFKGLPHVRYFAGNVENAVKAIRYVVAEKKKRVDNEGYKPYRLVLWIDELAQLAAMKDVAFMLGDLASIGRGKLINLVAATQYPTEKGGLGGLMKANFPIRCVGMVAPGQSHIATGRPQLHADMLPGRGSFLRCEGPDAYRFQSYHIETDEVTMLVSDIRGDYKSNTVKPLPQQSTVNIDPLPVFVPVKTDAEELAERIADLYRAGASKNAMSKHALGHPYGGSHAAKIDAAIQILGKNSSTTTSTTALDVSFEAKEGKKEDIYPVEEEKKVINMAMKRAARG